MKLLDVFRPKESPTRYSVDDYVQTLDMMAFQGNLYGGGLVTTLGGGRTEQTRAGFAGHAATFGSSSVVYACMLARMSVFSGVSFKFRNRATSELFGTMSLQLLERPWPGGTTQDVLLRMIQDADLAGNSYWTTHDGEAVRLRPDWTSIVLESRGSLGFRRIGYSYTEGGIGNGDEVFLRLSDVAHFAPVPDPLASYRGMSWLSPVLREVQADALMNRHERRFFENGATPNMIVKHPPEMTPQKVREFQQVIDAGHSGVDNAYRTLHIGGGADAMVVGSNFQQIDFRQVQGHGETRIAAAAGVPPVIVGLSEGLESATYSNYAQARRRFADGTMHPLWRNAAASMGQIIPAPGGSELWYDTRDVPFLREDEKDAADIQLTQAQTIRQLVDGGYTPESAQAAVLNGDFRVLQHTGLYSVQLQAPGAAQPLPSGVPV